MARDTDNDQTPTQPQLMAGAQTPLPLAERRRFVQPAKPQTKPEQIFTDWALI